MDDLRPFPFRPGELVFHFGHTSRHGEYIITPGRVLRVGKRVTIETAARRKVCDPKNLGYAAYCPHCEVPAFAGPVPTCPQCGQPAAAEVPPLDLVERWFEGTWPVDASIPRLLHALARVLVEGRPLDEGYAELRAWEHAHGTGLAADIRRDVYGDGDAEPAPPRRETLLKVRAIFAALLEQVDEELADADGAGLAIELPPRWTPPADDQQPDGGDDLTSWLDQQMGGA